MKGNLKENWMVSGSIRDDMISVLHHLSETTKLKKVRSDEIEIFTLLNMSQDKVFGFLQTKDGPVNTAIDMKDLIEKDGADLALLQETDELTKWLFKIGERYYFASNNLVTSLGIRTDLGGRALMKNGQKVRFYRDALFETLLTESPANWNIVYREEDGAKKMFYIGSDRFNSISQEPVIKRTLSLFEKEMGPASIIGYRIDNFASVIEIEFPDKANDFKKVYGFKEDIVPGAFIVTSDVGDSSYIVNGMIRIGKARIFVPNARYARQHTKNASIDKILENLDKEIFPEYRTVPDRLAELIMIDIPNPTEVIEKVARKIDLASLGKKFEKNFLEELINSVNPTLSYTAYDIATMFLDAGADAEDPNSTKETIAKMRNLFVQAVFYNY